MPSFEDVLRNLNTLDARLEATVNSVFLNNKTAWVNEIADSYSKYGINPNDTISKIAVEHKLNNDQVQRLVEESNVAIYLSKYAETKGKKVRRVEFDLADPQKVSLNTTASDSSMDFSMEKAASADDNAFNAFTVDSNRYEPSLWEKESMQKNAATMLKRKLTPRLEEEKKALIARLHGTLDKIAAIAEALIYNERAGEDANDLFNKIADDAELSDREVIAVAKCTTKKVEQRKKNRTLPKNFNVKLERKATDDQFSLGKHSLAKKAEEQYVVKAKHLPDQATYERLVALAKEVKKELEDQKPGVPVEIKVVR